MSGILPRTEVLPPSSRWVRLCVSTTSSQLGQLSERASKGLQTAVELSGADQGFIANHLIEAAAAN